MRVSTKGRYGVRLMLDLLEHKGDGYVALKEISERQSISEKYLWQIANRLKTAGMIRAVPGANGGFSLAKDPESLTLRDMLEVLEGAIELVECVEDSEVCAASKSCKARRIWTYVNERLSDTLSSITLQDMMDPSLIEDPVS